jgi:hypothetical protein
MGVCGQFDLKKILRSINKKPACIVIYYLLRHMGPKIDGVIYYKSHQYRNKSNLS